MRAVGLATGTVCVCVYLRTHEGHRNVGSASQRDVKPVPVNQTFLVTDLHLHSNCMFKLWSCLYKVHMKHSYEGLEAYHCSQSPYIMCFLFALTFFMT
jgi:hypothetical protein